MSKISLDFPILIFLIFLMAGCGSDAHLETIETTVPTSPSNNPEGLDIDETATLQSLAKLDDHPFYVMHYAGNYEYPQIGATWPEITDSACSLFVALGDDDEMVYGRNFDWNPSPALLLFTDPPDGYASVSMVALEFLGIPPEGAKDLTELPLERRTDLLDAPSMPFDGMNEYGLTIGMADLPGNYQEHAPYDPSKPDIGSIGIIRQILDHARNVDEAVAIFEQYNIDFRGGPLIHYLMADPGGKAVLVEFYQKKMIVLQNEEPWHLMTNHFRCNAVGDGGCSRYHTMADRLGTTGGAMNAESAMQLLSDVSQDMTQWSAVYNMDTGQIDVVMGGEYKKIFSFESSVLQP